MRLEKLSDIFLLRTIVIGVDEGDRGRQEIKGNSLLTIEFLVSTIRLIGRLSAVVSPSGSVTAIVFRAFGTGRTRNRTCRKTCKDRCTILYSTSRRNYRYAVYSILHLSRYYTQLLSTAGLVSLWLTNYTVADTLLFCKISTELRGTRRAERKCGSFAIWKHFDKTSKKTWKYFEMFQNILRFVILNISFF